ncbi:MAG: histidine--tRNA ligase [Mycobacteriales bacterium]
MASATQQNVPPSGTRDFLAKDMRIREHAFGVIRNAFERYGFEPLQTPAFERLEVLTGKYGEEGDKLIFKILRRGEHEHTGEADLALRYDLTVPLARVVAGYGSQLPRPYKRYGIAPVWRADRPGKGRFREFFQCDIDQVGSHSPLADAEIVVAISSALRDLDVADFQFLLNSRKALFGLLEASDIPDELGTGVLLSLDKLDKLSPDSVIKELVEQRGLPHDRAESLVNTVSGEDAVDQVRTLLRKTDIGRAGVQEIDDVLTLVEGNLASGSIAFSPQLVRGLNYYTGPIWEVVSPTMPGSIASGGRYDHLIETLGGPDLPACGGSLGLERILLLLEEQMEQRSSLVDVAVTVMGAELATDSFSFASKLRSVGIRTGLYLGSSGKLARQLKWASEQGARYSVIYGPKDQAAGQVTVRDMSNGEQQELPVDRLVDYLAGRINSATD